MKATTDELSVVRQGLFEGQLRVEVGLVDHVGQGGRLEEEGGEVLGEGCRVEGRLQRSQHFVVLEHAIRHVLERGRDGDEGV